MDLLLTIGFPLSKSSSSWSCLWLALQLDPSFERKFSDLPLEWFSEHSALRLACLALSSWLMDGMDREEVWILFTLLVGVL